jgi:hypothetical protein
MTKTLQPLLKGEKPSEEILSFFDKHTDKIQIPIGERFIVKEPSEEIRSFFDKIMDKFQIPNHLMTNRRLFKPSDVGEALNLKFILMVPRLMKYILKRKTLWLGDIRIFTLVKNLIPYWYARKWLPPLRDYSNITFLETRPESETYIIEGQEAKMYLKGCKPPKEILSFVENYIDGIHVPNGDESPFMMSFVHGAGIISPSSSPVEKVYKYMQAGSAKLAKDLWGLEEVETQQERVRMYRECSDLVQFWTMKGWLSIISPFATYEDLIRKLEKKENESGEQEK